MTISRLATASSSSTTRTRRCPSTVTCSASSCAPTQPLRQLPLADRRAAWRPGHRDRAGATRRWATPPRTTTALAGLVAEGAMSTVIFRVDDVDTMSRRSGPPAPRCCRSRSTSRTASATSRSATRRATHIRFSGGQPATRRQLDQASTPARARRTVMITRSSVRPGVGEQSRVSASSCGMTLVLRRARCMKFASPPQRGTTCWCRWSASEPPATSPRLRPTLKPCGDDADRIATTARRVNVGELDRLLGGQRRRARRRGGTARPSGDRGCTGAG